MTDRQRYINLGWELLEHKYRYYVLDAPKINDYDYDLLEKEYDALADKLGEPKTVSDMVGWKPDRWACKLVEEKIRKERSGV